MKKLTKSLVAMLALVAMLTQNAYGVYAAATSPQPIVADEEIVQPETEVVTEDASEENIEEGTQADEVSASETATEEVASETETVAESEDIPESEEVNYDDEIMLLDESSETDENVPESLDILETQISGSGLDSVEVLVDTNKLNEGDTFRIIFTGPDSARYDTRLNDNLDTTSNGKYRFVDLNKEGFNIHATSDDDVSFVYTSEDGTPVIKVISNVSEVEKKFTTKSITLSDGSPVIAIDGIGYDKVTLGVNSKELSDDAEYSLYVDTDAEVTVNGESISGKLTGLTNKESEFVVEGLDNEEFMIYVAGDNEVNVTSEIAIDNEEEGLATLILAGEESRVKADYEYEDENVKVTATLTDPKAVPDDAIFKVTQIVSENAVSAYIDALNGSAKEEEDKYTEENTLLYDVAFLVEKTDDEGNVIEGEYVEYEPEAGSVKIEITFKKAQISDELGAEEAEEVEINHLPLVDTVKNSVDTTVDANDAIDARDIIVEPVNAAVDVVEGAADTVELTLDNLSVVALTVLNSNVSVAKTTDYDLATSLGDANNYGVIANTYEQQGDTESNCYAELYKGSAQDLGASGNYSNAGGDNYIGDFASGCSLPIRFHQQPRYVYLGDAAWNKAYTGTDKSAKRATASEISSSYFDKTKCASTEFIHVQKNVAKTLSSIGTYYSKYSSLKDENNKAPQLKTVTIDNGAKLGAVDVDLTGKGAGLFVTNYAGGSLSTDGNGWMNLKIDPNTQTLLINVSPSNAESFDLSYFKINGNNVNSLVADKETSSDIAATSVIFNFGDYSGTINIKQIAAVIIAPKATVHTGSTCAGIVACDKLESYGGEWHYHNHNLPSPGSYTFKATKTFTNDRWPETGTIKLRLEALDSSDISNGQYGEGNWVSAKAPMPDEANGKDYMEIEVSKENPTAMFGTVEYPYNCPAGHNELAVNKNNIVNTRCYMYKITEVNTGISGVQYDTHTQVIKVWVNQYKAAEGVYRVALEINGANIPQGAVSSSIKCEGTLGDIKFTNTYNPAQGEIIIKKVITGKGLSVGPYYFEVQQKNSPYKRLTQNEGIDENYSKKHTFAINANETFKFENVPAGEYTVTEYKTAEGWKDEEGHNIVPATDSALGYKVIYSDGQNITISGNSSVTKVITNEATYGSAKITIGGEKSVNPVSYGIEDKAYNFTIKRATASDVTDVTIPGYNASAPLPGSTTVSNNAQGKFSFGEITYDADDIDKTYYYVVSENAGNAFGMTYDGKKFLVKVEVTNENGKVKAAKTISQIGGTLTSIKFTNNVSAKGSETFSAFKTLTGKTLEADKFTFKLEKSSDENGTNRTTLSETAKNAADGTVNFGVTENYTEANVGQTFYYFVTEIGPDVKTNGITYSKAEYRYTVTVTGIDKTTRVENGQPANLLITKTVDVKNADGTWSAYTENNKVPKFENTYDVEGVAEIKVHKNTGDTFSSGKLASTKFSFKVTQTDASGNAIANGYSKTEEVTGAGTATFTGLRYTSAGTYYYSVEEVLPEGVNASNPTKDGITYDVTKHTVAITVSDTNGDGTLEVTSQTNDGKAVTVNTVLEIKNTYATKGTSTDIEGTKTLSGKELEKNQFEFEITAIDGAPLPAVTKVKNGADNQTSKIKFGPINYTAEGTYKYHVKETSVNGSGITVDSRTYKVVVVVDDKNGQLSVTSKKYYIGDTETNPVSGLAFENRYTTEDGSATIEAQKMLNSNGIKTLKDKQFSFELCTLEGTTYTRLSDNYLVTNDGSGKVVFPEIKYAFADAGKLFTYYIHEVVTDKITGYTYDETYYPVYVTVTDNNNGKLSTTVKYGESKADSLTITNYYQAEGDATVTVNKKMVGRKLANGEVVSFRLVPQTEGDTNTEQVQSFTADGSGNTGSTSFNLHYEKTGTYKYTISEDKGSDANVSYDGNSYEVVVTVSDAAGAGKTTGYGKLATDVKVTGGKELLFVNTSKQEGKFTPFAKKTLTGGTLQNKQFTFTLSDGEGNVLQTKENDGKGAVSFNTIEYGKNKENYSTPVTYTYIIKETNDGKSYIKKYDDTEYKVEVTVSESETSALNVVEKYFKKTASDSDFVEIQNGSCADFEFVNTYEATGDVEFEAKKELEGATLLANEFSFELVNVATGEVLQTKPNDAKGKVKFDKLSYTQADLTGDSDGNGTYYKYYTIREKSGQVGDGYEYDDTEYVVIVSLRDNNNGTIATSYKIVKADDKPKEQNAFTAWLSGLFNRTGVSAEFKNKYYANGKLSLSGQKILTGKALTDGAYSFVITENGNQIGDAVLNVGNTVTFGDIDYEIDDIGTHTYVVTETHKNETIEGVHYSNASYTVTVIVAEKRDAENRIIRDGKLDVSAAVTKANTTAKEDEVAFSINKSAAVTAVGPLAFENEYRTIPAEVVVAGKKTISGLAANETISDFTGKFTFTMEDARVTDADGNALTYVKDYSNSQTNAANGTYAFEKITFTRDDLKNADGTYDVSRKFVYTVTESATAGANVDGILFDASNPKEVTVQVTDNGKGTIIATVLDKDSENYAVGAKFNNFKIAEGELPVSVTKEIDGISGSDKVFKFTLSGDDITTRELTLKQGETKAFEPVIKYTLEQVKNAGGTYEADYTVTEAASNYDGYTNDSVATHTIHAVVTLENGALVVKRTVDGETTAVTGAVSFTYTNKYRAKGGLELDGTKTMQGRDLAKDEFTFKLTGPKLPEDGITVTNASAENGVASTFEFVAEDIYDQSDIGKTYTYTVSEVIPVDEDKLPNVTYDREVYTVTVKVVNNGDGTLGTEKTIKNSAGTTSAIAFKNEYEDKDSVSFSAKKNFSGRTLENNMFTFKLEDVKGGKINKAETVKNTGANVVFKANPEYTQDDVGKEFVYKISEVKENKEGITYDETVYYAKVDVSIVSGEVIATRKYYSDAKCETEITTEVPEFDNSYSSKDSVDVSGIKKLEGFDKVTDKGTYVFELYENGNDTPIDTYSVNGQGSFKFPSTDAKKYFEYDQDSLKNEDGSYSESKEFIYTVKEQNGGQTVNGVTYDNTVYTVTVEVKIDATTGKIKATPHISPSVESGKLEFTNSYNAKNELGLAGKKTIEGKSLTTGAYKFALLKKVDGNFVEVATAVNDGPRFSFTPGSTTLKSGKSVTYFKYTQADIDSSVEYQVKETEATDGSAIDTTVYTVTDTISQNADGTLKIDRVITKPSVDEEGKETTVTVAATDFAFNNVYTAEGEITLNGTKTMENRALVEGEYTFVLKDADGNVVKGVDEDGNEFEYKVTNSTASLGKDAKAVSTFEFPALKYDQDALKYTDAEGNSTYSAEATFYYTVVEEIPSDKADCITYSDVVYNVAVTVKDSKKNDGKLVVTKVVTSNKYDGEDKNASILDKFKSIFSKLSADSESEAINFTNKYTAKGFWDPKGNKVLTGRELEDNAFQFKISEIDKLGGKVLKDEEGNELVSYVKNVGKTVTFNHKNVSWLEYGIEDVKTHYYRVEEVVPENKYEGDTYDNTVFEYVVDVTDNGNGTLEATTVKMIATKDKNSTTSTSGNFEFTFNNKYEAKGSIELKGMKTMTGRLLGTDKYSFSLYESDLPLENPVNVVKATNGEDGKIKFPELTYVVDATHSADSVLGEHHYIISEDDTTIPGVTKSEAIYRITVSVEDNDHSGNLKVYVSKVELAKKSASGYTFSGTDVNKESYFSFENKYEATADLAFVGTKHLKNVKGGKDVTSTTELEKKFTFKITQFDNADRVGTGSPVAGVKAAECDGNGNYKISGLHYSQEDLKKNGQYLTSNEFFYRIEEVVPAGAEKKELDGKEYWFYDGVYYNTDDIVNYDFNVTIEPTTPASNMLKVTVKDAKTGNVITAVNSGHTYTIGGNGYFDFENIKPKYKEIRGEKTWVDSVTDPAKRPTVTVRLYSSADNFTSVIDTRTIVAPNLKYEFLELPAVDKEGNEITYKVDEAELAGYTCDQNGYDFINTSGDLLIRKVNARTGIALEGAVLVIYDKDGKEVDRWTSGSSAHSVDPSKVKVGATYTLHEESAPAGYKVAADKSFVMEAGTTTVTMEDEEITGSVRLRKLDAETREALSGAEFALYTESGDRIYASGAAGSYTYSRTSSNGRFAVNGSGELYITGLPYGSYYFVEIEAPAGYVMTTDRATFSVLTDGSVAEVTMLNAKEKGSVRLRKTNSDGSLSLAGAVFELYAKTPSSISAAVASTIYRDAYYRVGSYTTDASGMIYVGDLPWDDYYFVEVQAPAGYQVTTEADGSPIVYTFTISSTATADVSYDLGGITNSTSYTPPERGGEVRGERRPEDKGRRSGGVLSGVLGVRAAPKSGVLGERLGPVTGDAFNIFLWTLLLLASIGAIITVAVANAKRKRQVR